MTKKENLRTTVKGRIMADNTVLMVYGPVSTDFKDIAKLKNQAIKIKSGQVQQHRLDCYRLDNTRLFHELFARLNIQMPENVEVFWPSDNYTAHTDEGGTSYFVPLESGFFYIDGVSYPVVPFVLYAFNDGVRHNTDFCAVMLK